MGIALKATGQSSAPPHLQPIDEVFEHFGTGRSGLSAEEARKRLEEFGPNELVAVRRVSPWGLLLAQFKNVLIVILLVATALSGLPRPRGRGDRHRRHRAVRGGAGLRPGVPRRARHRGAAGDGRADCDRPARWRETEVPARDLVPGDLLLLSGRQGPRRCPAGRGDRTLQTEEAALTGESRPDREAHEPAGRAIRRPWRPQEHGPRRNRRPPTAAAAPWSSPRAWQTEFGKIAGLLQTVETGKTPLQENLDKVGCSWPASRSWLCRHRRARPVPWPAVRRDADLRHRAGGRRRPRGSAGGGHHLAGPRRAADGQAPCAHAPPAGGRDARQHVGDLLGQDRHADQGRNDRPQDLRRRPDVRGLRHRLRASRRVSRATAMAVEPTRAIARTAPCRRPRLDAHLERPRTADAWHVKGDPTEGALVVAAAKAGLREGRTSTASSRACPKSRSPPRPSA